MSKAKPKKPVRELSHWEELQQLNRRLPTPEIVKRKLELLSMLKADHRAIRIDTHMLSREYDPPPPSINEAQWRAPSYDPVRRFCRDQAEAAGEDFNE